MHASHDDDDPAAPHEGRRPSGAASSLLVYNQGQIALYPIPREGTIVIGRGRDCGIQIDHRSVSRRHAAIHAGSPPEIEDLTSHNGTRVRGMSLEPGQRVALSVGTTLALGVVAAFIQRASVALDRGVHGAHEGAVEELRARAIVVDPAMQQIYQLLRVIAPAKMNVLILGEAGVGKEVYAEALHRNSSRKDAPFVRLNCAALSGALLEAELFGYQRGAFSGAIQAKPGLFEIGNGGTLFLDEVGELPLATQAKLLRVIEAGEVTRLGGTTPRRADVRVLSATSRMIEDQVETGAFRKDLFHRLDEFVVTIPPLRERPGDLAVLATHFAAHSGAAGEGGCTISEEALAIWRHHPWRGNVRELRNVVERAALLCRARGGRIDVDHARVALAGTMNVPQRVVPAPEMTMSVVRRRGVLRREIKAIEKLQIERALDRCGGNQSRAAAMLGIGRRTLLIKLDMLDITRPSKRIPRLK